ncbi:MAG: hypothetical protein A3B23_03310 [Candidatus Colwellbacteria bacterium RIFCSPLOWO2_01_FULL_48_10]|uniref:Uncharacterized protein n=2 Tax=Bacteria candidate phyla TaxID=1783234 RepID=A0A1F5NYH8_9BACT|nr:MAG: hypothetical protein A2846_01535 [Candidatus Doudnabacteria bacterium RIFCSPHIGHO2_01_FULL_49_9]OGY59673.1 MAG: hypothetical protein A3B23_03310 [Candidatus Colwellbacteria bacterium RIFCSPLOWO2_01_FULL_48_10]
MNDFENVQELVTSKLPLPQDVLDVGALEINKTESGPAILDGDKSNGPENKMLWLETTEQLKSLNSQTELRQLGIDQLTKSVHADKKMLDKAREGLGLPPNDQDSPVASIEKGQMERLRAEQAAIEQERKELLEQLIQQEKENILREKLDGLFKEFKQLNEFSPLDFESIFASGQTREGYNFESKTMGSLDPETAQSLSRMFNEGIRLLPEILKAMPGLLKKFDEELTEEATRRVEENMEQKEQKVEADEEQKRQLAGEKPEISGTGPVEGADAEKPNV